MLIKYNNHMLFFKTIDIADISYPILFKMGNSIDILYANIFSGMLSLTLFTNNKEQIKINIYIDTISADKPFLMFDFFKRNTYFNENVFPNNIEIFDEKFISLFNHFIFNIKPLC